MSSLTPTGSNVVNSNTGDLNVKEATKGNEPPKLDSPIDNLETNANKFQGLKNTLGYLGMGIKALGKTSGALIMGATAAAAIVPAGVVGMASGGIVYGASRMLGVKEAKAVDYAAATTVATGATTAMVVSLLAVPFSLAAWSLKGIGSALMKPAGGKEMAPAAYQKFDDSFSTHILPLLGKMGNDSLLAKAGRSTNKIIQDFAKPAKAEQKKASDTATKEVIPETIHSQGDAIEIPEEVSPEPTLIKKSAKETILKDLGEEMIMLNINYKNLTSSTTIPGYSLMLNNDYLYVAGKDGDTNILQIQNKNESVLIEYNRDSQEISINGKPVNEYGDEVIQKTKDLLHEIALSGFKGSVNRNATLVEPAYIALNEELAK